MDKTNGFLNIERRNAGRQEVHERLQHFREFRLRLTLDDMRAQAARCMDCGVPFCQGAGCPLGNAVPDFVDLVYRGRWRDAADLLHRTNNFPEITGRICPALCEAACVNAVDSQATSIRDIELEVVERAFDEGWVQPKPPAVLTGKRVAISRQGRVRRLSAPSL